MIRLLLSVAVIFVSLALGYWYRQKKAPESMGSLMALRDRLQFLAFFCCIPISSMLSLWGMPQPDARLLLFPLLGISAWLLGGVTALVLARLLRFSRTQTGSLFCCGTFSNIGAVGTLVCVVFFGEQSIAYVALYRFCEEMIYYGAAFPFAARYTEDTTKTPTVQGFRISNLVLCVLAALLLGIVLNKTGVPRPDGMRYVASFLSIVASVLALFSIGLGLKLSKIATYTKACLSIVLIKFCVVPLAIGTLAYALGFGSFENALPLAIAVVLSSMPVAMNALIPPALLLLDLDLANACWIASTLALLVVLPILKLGILPLIVP